MTPATELLLPDTKTPDSSASDTQLVAVDIQQPAAQQPPSAPAKSDAVTSVRADEKSVAKKSWLLKKEWHALLFLIILFIVVGLITSISVGIGESFAHPSPSPIRHMSGQDAYGSSPGTRFCIWNSADYALQISELSATTTGDTSDAQFGITRHPAIFDAVGITNSELVAGNGANYLIAPRAAQSTLILNRRNVYIPLGFSNVDIDGRPSAPVSGDTETHDAYDACGFWTNANTPPNTNQVPQPVSASGLAMVAASAPIADSKLEVSENELRFNQ